MRALSGRKESELGWLKMFINYAHRGASEYAPENTMAAFYLGLEMGANGIETDVQKTKNGVLVLFHDKELSRVANGQGKISDYTYKELYQLDAGSYKGDKYKNEKIVRFDDFLHYFAPKDLHFAIELKETLIEKEVIEAIDFYGIRNKVIITSFDFEHLIHVRKLDGDIKIGFLCTEINEEVLQKLMEIHANQICPAADKLTSEGVQFAKSKGFSVRAWGVKNEELMQKALGCGVDGMTVNFPDKLKLAIS